MTTTAPPRPALTAHFIPSYGLTLTAPFGDPFPLLPSSSSIVLDTTFEDCSKCCLWCRSNRLAPSVAAAAASPPLQPASNSRLISSDVARFGVLPPRNGRYGDDCAALAAAAAAAADPAAAADCNREFCNEFCGERKGDVLALRMR